MMLMELQSYDLKCVLFMLHVPSDPYKEDLLLES